MKNISDNSKGLLYALVTAGLWGVLAVAIKVTLNTVDPVNVVWFRFSLAFICLVFLQLFRNPGSFKIIFNPPKLVFISAIGLGLNYIGFIEGIHHTSPNIAQIFIQFGPISLALVGIFVYKEKLSSLQIFGFLLALAGFVFFYREQLKFFTGGSAMLNKGVAFLIFGALSWLIYSLVQKKLVRTTPTVLLNLFNFGLPAIVFSFFADFSILKTIGLVDWALLVFLGLNTLFAYGALSEALKYTQASKVSIIITLNPVITFSLMAVIGMLEVAWIKPEVYTTFTLIGAVMVLSGAVFVAAFRSKS